MQKLARAVIGTNNMDNCSRYCQSPATMGLFRTVGYGGDSGSIKDIENASLVLIIGSNTAESHPVLATRVKRAHKLRGQKLIVSDLRENEMAKRADLFLRPKPGTDMVWLSAIARYILDQGLAKTSFLSQMADETGQKLMALGMDMLGAYAPLREGSRWAKLGGQIQHLYQTSLGHTIAGGTSEILRTTVATRGLGLPADKAR